MYGVIAWFLFLSWERIISSYYFWGILFLLFLFLFWIFKPISKSKRITTKSNKKRTKSKKRPKVNKPTQIDILLRKIKKERKIIIDELVEVGIIQEKDIKLYTKSQKETLSKLLNSYIIKKKGKKITKSLLQSWVGSASSHLKEDIKKQINKSNNEHKNIKKTNLLIIENIKKTNSVKFSNLRQLGIVKNITYTFDTDDYLYIDQVLNNLLRENNEKIITEKLLVDWSNQAIEKWEKNRNYISLLNKIKNNGDITILDLKKIGFESIVRMSEYDSKDIVLKLNEKLHNSQPSLIEIEELIQLISSFEALLIGRQDNILKEQPAQQHFLKKVIKILPQKMKATMDSSVVTSYPTNIGILGFIGKKEVKYFEVSNNTDNRNYADNTQEITINDFDTGMRIILILRYRLSCPLRKEVMLTEFLGASETPEKALLDFIDKFTHQFYNERLDDFVVNLEQNFKELVLALDQEVEKQSGLKLVSKVSLKNADKVTDITLSDRVKVVPHGIEQSVVLKINYLLKANNKNIAALHMNRTSDIQDIKIKIKDLISGYISEKIDAHTLFFKFINKENELNKLTDKINNMLTLYGREIKFQKMNTANINVEKLAEVELEQVRRPIDRIDQKIIIKNKLQFELSDVGRYLKAGMPDLKEWANKTLNELYQLKVFNWEYIDYLVNFEDLKSEIETTMRVKALKIGYTINQIISEPKLAENAFLRMDTHMFEYKELATADSGITSDLNVTVTFMLNDKKAFRELLKYDDNAKESLRKIFEVELKKVLSYETPERIFLQYYNDSFQGANESLKTSLEKKVKKHLMEKLNATVQDIHIVPVDNGILEPLYTVRGQSKHIELELSPKIEGDPIKYRATLVVHGQDNNNWSQLIEGKYTMERITELVVRTLKAEFNMLSEEELRFRSLEHRRGIEKIADKLAKEVVAKRFGLIVEIENLDRDKNSEEVLALQNKIRQMEYVYNQKDSNLEFLTERNMQDREQMLHLSGTEESKAEMEEYAKRVGIEEIDINVSSNEKNTVISGLMKLAEETQDLRHLGSCKNSLFNFENLPDNKQIAQKDDK